MPSSRQLYTCLRCRTRSSAIGKRKYHSSNPFQAESPRPSVAPRPIIDIKHIRQNPQLYENSCIDRNYKAQSVYPARISTLFEQWQGQQRLGRSLRERSNLLRRELANPASLHTEDQGVADIKTSTKDEILEEARGLKKQLSTIEIREAELISEIESLAESIPNLTSDETPRSEEPTVLGYINDHPEPEPSSSDRVWRSHSHIGSELSLLDFAGAGASSGWGWYYLLNEAALLEQALVQYAISTAMSKGWQIVSPPSVVYSHITSACGFQPRDQNDEQQIYNLAQSASDAARGKPELSLAATAEIPLAAMHANSTIEEADLPMKRIAVSRCYRAEAGARGVDTKGLYRVHEFTKVEMFAWTLPSTAEATCLFDEMLGIQTQILESLDLHCRVLEMPSVDLGASATRKRDIEAFFPSRRARDDGWGEVTSTSICSDYQSRRLATRLRLGGKLAFPWTVNGTAMAVPRVLAAILENGWDEKSASVRIPPILKPWMGGRDVIEAKHRQD
ncbi:MAG: Serine--tRNA ligase, mitochondrial [Claussenomyces sp. TS43310]|nr:MAG: Serine--tRNA ligase, mitochondrial [Claussenomyces sp. TS43310]